MIAVSLCACPPDPETCARQGKVVAVVGYATVSTDEFRVVPPEQAVTESGADAVNEDVWCYAEAGGFSMRRGVIKTDNSFDLVSVNVADTSKPPLHDWKRAPIRVSYGCDDGSERPSLMKASWVDVSTGKAISSFNISDTTRTTGLIRGTGALCVYNPTNRKARVKLEAFFSDSRCVVPGSKFDAERNLLGASLPKETCSKPGPVVQPCPIAGEQPQAIVSLCQICGAGTSYVSRSTVETYAACPSVAKLITQALAANCEVKDGPC